MHGRLRRNPQSGLAGNRGNADRGLREQVPHHVELGARVARLAAKVGALVIGLRVLDSRVSDPGAC